MSLPKISLCDNELVVACATHAAQWANTEVAHYSSLMCMKTTGTVKTGPIKIAREQMDQWILDQLDLEKLSYCCVLPKGHTEACTYNPVKSMFKNKTLGCKCDWLFATPGDDDYIYKNRASRLFPFKVPDFLQKVWRDKNKKRKCAIPLKEGSTPEMMAAAWLDYITLMLSVRGIDDQLKDFKHMKGMREMVAVHKVELIKHYKKFGKTVFNSDGFTLCPVMGKEISVDMLSNPDLCDLDAIQLGHVVPRSDSEFTVRGKNVLMMTRRGNLLVGDCSFVSNEWIEQMKQAIAFQSR